ncbi:putative reverse transcriptase domain-containing protein [Tanacetum coccineum]
MELKRLLELNEKETEGAVGLCRWFKKMESTFGISECAERRKVKFATATLHGRALTWWNSQVATLGLEVANGKSWTEVKQMMIDEFCLTKEVQRLEEELRHLKLRDMNIVVYTERKQIFKKKNKKKAKNKQIQARNGKDKSKVRHSRSKAIVAKVSTSASTSGVSPDVAELKDMVRALLLDKQTSPVPAPAPVKAVEQRSHFELSFADALLHMPKFAPSVFVVVDYDADPRVPLILGRPFLRTARALIDVHGEKMTLRHDDQSVIFKVGDTKNFSFNAIESVDKVDFIDIACKEYSQEILGFSEVLSNGNSLFL